MLKSWSIQNFKPILNSGELRLAPVTVLAGRNSSGKSSLIQSILMIAQTLSSRVLDRPLLPHGSFAHLGTFEDILNKYSGIGSLTIEFQMEVEKEELTASPRRKYLGSSPINRLTTDLNIKSLKVKSQFTGAKTIGASSSAIAASKVNVEHVLLETNSAFYEYHIDGQASRRDKPFEFSVDIKRLSNLELEKFLGNVIPEYLRLVPYTDKDSNYLATFVAKDENNNSSVPDPSLVSFSHFLPTRLITKFKVEERRKQQLTTIISRIFDSPETNLRVYRGIADFFDPDAPFSTTLNADILKICADENVPEAFSGQSLREFARWFKVLKLGRGPKKANLGSKIRRLIAQSILDQLAKTSKLENKGSEALEAIFNNIYTENLEQAVEQITRFFTSKIRYLGPLRADPEILQGFPSSSELDDVGLKGQYAATVYEANQKANIPWYNPISQKIEQSTLKMALDTWARYLDVAYQIELEIAGQSGVSWQIIHRDGHDPLPLTAVGVGISQILPILVMGLLAPNSTLLLVEQPELHLHPAVQARLGDFFMGLAKCGKQCIIETHSENLVNQLRYHIVQSGGQDKSDCLIYFVDQDDRGAAKFEPVEISPQGNILNWPEGFFDETMLQEGRITTASLRKRATKANNG
jgi:predicted ATPase